MRLRYPRILFAALVLLSAAGAVYALAPEAAAGLTPLTLQGTAVPLSGRDPGLDRVGRLRFLGALVLRSPDRDFGGMSGLRAGADGNMLAISDTGNWLSFTIQETDDRLTGVTGGTIAPLRDASGGRAPEKEDGDAEAVDRDPTTGAATVSFEQNHRLQVYHGIDPAAPASFAAPAAQVLHSPLTAAWPANTGGEGLARLPDGRLLQIAEGTNAAGTHDVLLWTGDTAVALALKVPESFMVTDALALADGRLLVLLRKLSVLSGFSAGLLEVTLPPELHAGMVLEGELVARLQAPLTIDNMEGLAVRQTGARTFVYLVSDDNFMPFQRTLLMKFELLR